MPSADKRRHHARRIAAGTLFTTLATGSAVALGSPAAHAAKGPEVIGHRGGTDYGTENSLKTVKKAFRRGADAVEIDVQWTRDLRTVVMHDATMNRTSNCSGTVTRMAYEKFRSCELNDGTKAPHVYEMLEAVDRAGKDVYLHVRDLDSPAKARKIVRALNKFGMNKPSRATVISTKKSNLDLLARYGYEGHRGLLFRHAVDWNANYSVLLPYNTRVTESLVKKAHRAGKKVVVVEGHPTALHEVLDLRVDGFMANDLLYALEDLGKALVEVESQIAQLGG